MATSLAGPVLGMEKLPIGVAAVQRITTKECGLRAPISILPMNILAPPPLPTLPMMILLLTIRVPLRTAALVFLIL